MAATASLVGRFELLAWLNRTLGTDYLRLEECADCVGYSQLLEAVHPGTVPLHRLHLQARRAEERRHNAKILAAALHRANITCPNDLRMPMSLANGRFVDHHEFLRWLLGYLQSDAARVRALAEHDFAGGREKAQRRAQYHAQERARTRHSERLRAHGVHVTCEQLAAAMPAWKPDPARPPPPPLPAAPQHTLRWTHPAPPTTTLAAWPAAAGAPAAPAPQHVSPTHYRRLQRQGDRNLPDRDHDLPLRDGDLPQQGIAPRSASERGGGATGGGKGGEGGEGGEGDCDGGEGVVYSFPFWQVPPLLGADSCESTRCAAAP
jgi:hypothetical protein